MTLPCLSPALADVVSTVLGSPGEPLDSTTRAMLEVCLGHDFSPVAPPKGRPGWVVSQPGEVHECEAQRLAERALDLLESPSGPVVGGRRHDFRQVRIHWDARAAASARALHARAYTVGRHIVFAAGQYAPHTRAGRLLLAHELAHVLQQQHAPAGMIQRAECDTATAPKDLEDSLQDLNARVNLALKNARTKAPPDPKHPVSSADFSTVRGQQAAIVIQGLYDELCTNPLGIDAARVAIDDWAQSLPKSKVNQPEKSKTKYAGVTFGLWNTPFEILNPSMKVNGILIGSDKLGHFLQQGVQYLATALSARQGAAAEKDPAKLAAIALAAAENLGRDFELHGFGLDSTGVYSNGDLAANRKGFRFYQELAANPMTLYFDMKNYIDADWNEEHNPSFYEKTDVGPTVWKNLLTGKWQGDFIDKGGAVESIIVQLKVTGKTDLSGSFEYGPNGVGKGTITNGRITHRASITVPDAIQGVDIAFEWQSGSNKGKGSWKSIAESTLTGQYGSNNSATDGGQWFLNKQ